MASGVDFGFILVVVVIPDAKEFAVEHSNDVATHFLRIAMGVELGLDIGAFGPFPEEGFKGFFVFRLLQGQALLLEMNAAGNEVATAEGDDVGEELADLAQLGFLVVGNGGGVSGGSEAERNPVDEMIDEWLGGNLG